MIIVTKVWMLVKQVNELESEDKAMIVNIADEIYNISSRGISGVLYRQVLGEKLVLQQQYQTYDMINQVLQMVSGFAESTQLLLDAFLEHEHALPKIDLNLEKTIKHRDVYRTPDRYIRTWAQTITLPPRRVRTKTGTRTIRTSAGRNVQVPVYTWGIAPRQRIRIPSPPRVQPGRYRTRVVRQKINFEATIGGEENPRFTAAVATTTDNVENPATPVGEKTGKVDRSLDDMRDNFSQQQERLERLTAQVSKVLSKNQFVN